MSDRCYDISEKELEYYLLDHPELLKIDRWVAHQFKVPSGVIDLLGITQDPFGEMLVVVELKTTRINQRALTQVYRYARDILNAAEYWRDFDDYEVGKRVVGFGEITNQVFRESEAMGIKVYTFDVINTQFGKGIDIKGPYSWKIEFRRKINQAQEELANHRLVYDTYTNRKNWRE